MRRVASSLLMEAMRAWLFAGVLFASAALRAESVPTDRSWDVLPPVTDEESAKRALAAAGAELGDWQLDIAGAAVDGDRLSRLARTPAEEPLVRALREDLGRPVDLVDFLHFLDDVLKAGRAGLRGYPVVLTPHRARAAGIFLHPDEVFRKRPRVYGEAGGELPIDPPSEPEGLSPPPDGAPLGPDWWARYRNPGKEREHLAALEAARPKSDFSARLQSLIRQLRAQGAEVQIESSVRPRERGYLMWGAFWLSRAESERQLCARVRELDRLNKKWGLFVPIRWMHPDGWRATQKAAREMAEAYDVVYATRRGARSSNHYGGEAVDLVATGLPRTLTLTGADGVTRTFDLSHPDEPRDLNLTPELVHFVEEHFFLEKLERDYPHWDDRGDERRTKARIASVP